MTPTDLGAWVGAVAGTGGVLIAVAALIKARPEIRKTNADATKVLTDSSVSLATRTDAYAVRLESKVDSLEAKVQKLLDREDEQGRLLLRHERWDLDVAGQVRELGGQVSDPPPLYPPTAA